MSIDTAVLAIERSLWTNDAACYENNLTDDALLVFAETGAISRDIAVAAIREENAAGRQWADVEFSDIRVLQLDDAVMVTYRAISHWGQRNVTDTALASSLYVQRDGRWKLAFHQQTPLPIPS
jgi:uncharacterized protein (TIGR02246 family)